LCTYNNIIIRGNAGEPDGVKNRLDSGFCGIDNDGALYCWGYDILTMEMLVEPKLIDKGPWKEVGVGYGFLCALSAKDDFVYCYGTGADGQLGDGSSLEEISVQSEMTPIVGSTEFTTLTVGGFHVCAISKDESAFCWGLNDYGQLGTGDNVSSSTPLEVFSDSKNWRDISAGRDHTCATKNNDEGWCWGNNQYNQVSPKSKEVTLVPSKREGSWNTISAGRDYTLGIDTSGSGFGWGLSEMIDYDFGRGGMLGDNSSLCYDLNTTEPGFCDMDTRYKDGTVDENTGRYVRTENVVPIAGNKVWESVSAGSIPCAIEQDTQYLYCWGYTLGESYLDGSPQINYPMLVNGTEGTQWLSISSGDARCGIQKDGTGWCWGKLDYDCDNNCPLGDGTKKNSAIPVKVVKVNDWLDNNIDLSTASADSSAPSPAVLPPTPVLDGADNEGTPSTPPATSSAVVKMAIHAYALIVTAFLLL